MSSRTKALFIALVCILPTQRVVADVTQLVFTTDPQTINPNTLSEVLTVQTQSTAGVEEKISETADITFTSSSATGEFLGSTGNPVSTVMSKNTANRSFYYRDGTEGEHTLTVTVQLRNGGPSWSATQQIRVGSVSAQSTGTSSNSEATVVRSSGSSAARKGQEPLREPLSTHAAVARLERLSAGRERFSSPHTPLHFDAHELLDDLSYEEGALMAQWSFGDGTRGVGTSLMHSYLYPGTYNVVLNVDYRGNRFVARTKVYVVEPELVVHAHRVGDSVEVLVKNGGAAELNLGSFTLAVGELKMSIADDTILDPGSSLTLTLTPRRLLSEDAELILSYPDGVVVARTTLASRVTNTQLHAQLATLEQQARALAMQAASLAPRRTFTQEEVATTLPKVRATTTQAQEQITELPRARPRGLFERFMALFAQ